MDVCNEELKKTQRDRGRGVGLRGSAKTRSNPRERKIAPKMERTSPHVFPPLPKINFFSLIFFFKYLVLLISKGLTFFVAKKTVLFWYTVPCFHPYSDGRGLAHSDPCLFLTIDFMPFLTMDFMCFLTMDFMLFLSCVFF